MSLEQTRVERQCGFQIRNGLIRVYPVPTAPRARLLYTFALLGIQTLCFKQLVLRLLELVKPR